MKALIPVVKTIACSKRSALPVWPLIQAMNIQFTLTSAFAPADLLSWALCLFHSGFCFMFGTIVISMFVSLLNIQPIQK